MLPLWRDQISVGLAPHGVTWVRLARGLQPAVAARGYEHVQPHADEHIWQAALTRLGQMLPAEEWKDAAVRVVLSNHFVRYDCLPWNDAASDEEAQTALARHRLIQIYGPAAQTWEVRMSPAGKGEARLVAAADDALITALKQAVEEAETSLHSIQPYLMSSFNHYAKELAQADGWFVAAEEGRFALALFNAGQWKRIVLRRGNDLASLHEWLERENLAGGGEASSREVFLFGPGLPKEGILPSYHLHRLELPARKGYSPITDAQFTIALSGIA